MALIAALVAAVVPLVGCGDNAAGPEPGSMRDRLEAETRLLVASGDSAGAVTAQLRIGAGWDSGLVDLKPAGGELVASAVRGGALQLTALTLELETIAIPASVIGHDAELSRPVLRLTAPASVAATWTGEDQAEAEAALPLELSWTLSVDGVGLPLGAPSLPPLPVKLQLSGDGARVTAEIRVHVAGELWSWADLIKLSDLDLVLAAGTPEP
jgi:hypothetical protein